jgi:ABC-type methionine transport system ATPase subunit
LSWRKKRPETAMTQDLPQGLLQASVVLDAVTAPELAEFCPGPVSLAVGLTEFVVLEGLTTKEADSLLRLTATLRAPAKGRLFHWGRNLFALSREELYPWRRRLALVSPFQSLLPRLTVRENVTLSQILNSSKTPQETAQEQRELLMQLSLWDYLSFYPGELPLRQYHLALWARELIKEPLLILGVMPSQAEECDAPTLTEHLLPWLEKYHSKRRGAIVLAGPQLDFTYHVADRRLHCRGGQWQEQFLPGRRDEPLIKYVDLL